jgi:hypothetical protein
MKEIVQSGQNEDYNLTQNQDPRSIQKKIIKYRKLFLARASYKLNRPGLAP